MFKYCERVCCSHTYLKHSASLEEKIQGIPAHTGSKSPPYGERVEHMNLNEEEIMGKNEDEIKSEGRHHFRS